MSERTPESYKAQHIQHRLCIYISIYTLTVFVRGCVSASEIHVYIFAKKRHQCVNVCAWLAGIHVTICLYLCIYNKFHHESICIQTALDVWPLYR